MKKIISILISAIIVSGCFFTVFATDEFADIRNLGFIEDVNENDAITKAEFAALTAKLMGSGTLATKDTRYQDVTVENSYSGYIEFVAANGVVDNTPGIAFNPNASVSLDMANKMIVNALGYNKLAEYKGGYPTGYTLVSNSLKLMKNINFNDIKKLTHKEAWQMCQNALYAEMPSSSNVANDGWDLSSDGEDTILTLNHGISVYSGTIESAYIGKSTIDFLVEKSMYASEQQKLNPGDKIVLSVSGTIDVAHFEHAPVELWVKDEKVIFIKEKKNVSIKYQVVSSVNGKLSESASLSAKSIREVCFYDDEEVYDFAQNGKIYYNGVEEKAAVSLNGKLCKVIFEDREIHSIETWDLAEGGIVTELTDEVLSYRKADGKIVSIKDVYDYKNIRTIINGRGAELTEIKPNSVFDWWKDDDNLVICINEHTVVDEFTGYSHDRIEIGNGTYLTDDVVYYSMDGEKYTSTRNDLLGYFVKCRIAPNGKVRYVEKYGSDDKYEEFYAIVKGVEQDRREPSLYTLMLLPLKDGSEIIYLEADDDRINCVDTSLEEIRIQDKSKITENVFLITSNKTGRIVKIERAKRLFGFEDDYETPATFINGLNSFSAGGKMLHFDGILTTVVYEANERTNVKQVDFRSVIGGRPGGTGATMSFFAKTDSLSPDLILLSGDVSNIGKAALQMGIYFSKNVTINSDGDIMYKITVLKKEGEQEYLVSPETAALLKEESLIFFYEDLIFSDEEISLHPTKASIELKKAPSEWLTTDDTAGFKKGRVVGVNDKMLVCDVYDSLDNFVKKEAFPVHPSNSYWLEYDSGKDRYMYEVIPVSEISQGDTIFFYNEGDGVKLGIVVR